MALTQLSNLTGYEVSLVPHGANKKKRFLVVKSNGELDMDKLLEQILKEGLKDEEAVDAVAKSLGLEEDGTKVLKAIMKMVGAEASPLSREKLMKALEEMMPPKKEEPAAETTPAVEKECGDGVPVKEEASVNKEGSNPKRKTEGEGMPAKVPVQKEDGSWDLTGVDETIRPALEAVCKSNEQLTKSLNSTKTENKTLADKLAAEQNLRIMKEFEEKAKSFGHEGAEATKIAKILKSAYDASEENGKQLEEVLKSAHAKIEEGRLFAEHGTTGGINSGASAWTKIEKSAEEICKSDSKLTQQEAIDLVLQRNPKLYDEYQEEKRRGV